MSTKELKTHLVLSFKVVENSVRHKCVVIISLSHSLPHVGGFLSFSNSKRLRSNTILIINVVHLNLDIQATACIIIVTPSCHRFQLHCKLHTQVQTYNLLFLLPPVSCLSIRSHIRHNSGSQFSMHSLANVKYVIKPRKTNAQNLLVLGDYFFIDDWLSWISKKKGGESQRLLLQQLASSFQNQMKGS